MADSRTKNTSRNMIVSLVCYSLYTILSFVIRKVFIMTLSEDYLGISGLFTNILTILSFAEMGIGNAIIFNLYKPIAVGDKEQIKSLMNLYKKAYTIIGVIVLGAGLLIIPFLGYFVKDPPVINESLTVIYLFYLLNTSLSYFFSYKQSIITANQKSFVVTLYTNGFRILQMILQGILLFTTHNFLLYLSAQLVCTLLNNFLLAQKADKMYPEIKEKNIVQIPKEERNRIFANVRALFLYKLGSTVLNGTDNIIVSKIVGLKWVGYVSNYSMIIVAISSIVDQIPNAVIASVGNLNATESKEKKEHIFNVILYVCAWIYGFCAVGMFFFSSDFVSIAFGDKWRISGVVVFALALHFYVSSVSFPSYTYRTTMGYFVQGKFAPACAAVINIVLSVVLGKTIGLAGVYFATSISRFFTMGIVDPVLIFKNGFGKNPLLYYLRYFAYFIIVSAVGALSYIPLMFIPLGGLAGFIVKLVVFSVVFNLLFMLATFKTKEFAYVKNVLLEKVVGKLLHGKDAK